MREKRWGALPPAVLWMLGGGFGLGGLAGCAVGLSSGAGEGLSAYLQDYLTLAAEETASISLLPVLWEQMRFLLLLLLLTFTAVGVVGLPVLFVARGFLFTFPVACFCGVFGAGGLLPAALLFGLPALVWAPAFFVLGVQGFGVSCVLLRRVLGESRCPLPCDSAFWVRCALCVLTFLLCGVVEFFAVAPLMGAAARAVL